MEKQSLDSEEYKLGLEYEVLSESINLEIAHHSELMHEIGAGCDEAQAHRDEIIALVKLRNSVRVRDESTIKNAWLVLDAMKAARRDASIAKSAVA